MKNLLYLLLLLISFSHCKHELPGPVGSEQPPVENEQELEADMDLNISMSKFDWEAGDYIFESKTTGHRLVKNKLEKTVDGGSTWTLAHEFPTISTWTLPKLYYANKDSIRLFFGSSFGDDIIIRNFWTVDGGADWQEQYESFYLKNGYDFRTFVSFYVGFYIFMDDNYGRVVVTQDGGNKWATISPYILRPVGCVMSENIFTLDREKVLASSDLGQSWTTFILPPGLPKFDRFVAPEPGMLLMSKKLDSMAYLLRNDFSEMKTIYFPGPATQNGFVGKGGYCLLSTGSSGEQNIFITKNGGTRWHPAGAIGENAPLIVFNQNAFPVYYTHKETSEVNILRLE